MSKRLRCLCGWVFNRESILHEHQIYCEVYQAQVRRNTSRPSGPQAKQQSFFVDDSLVGPPYGSTCLPIAARGVTSAKPIGGFSKVWDFAHLGYSSHNHAKWMKVGQYRIMGCSLNGGNMVGLRVVLDSGWLSTGMMLTGFRSRFRGAGRMVYVVWRDQDAIPLDAYRRLVYYIVSRLRGGEEVSVGCVGGHGRTGTVLAGVLAVMEKLSASASIREVRKRYCDRAVETTGQVNLVRALRGESLLLVAKATVSSYWQEDLTNVGE